MKLRFLLIAALLSSAVLAASQTSAKYVSESFPLSLWAEHKQVTQIPWSASIGKAYFRSDLRQELQIGALIKLADLEKTGDTHDLVFFVRALDGASPITSIHTVTPKDFRGSTVVLTLGRVTYWSQMAIVQPGKYKLEMALLDRATGRYSTRYENLTVSGNESDPLEQSLR